MSDVIVALVGNKDEWLFDTLAVWKTLNLMFL